jgi:hypothetical protein
MADWWQKLSVSGHLGLAWAFVGPSNLGIGRRLFEGGSNDAQIFEGTGRLFSRYYLSNIREHRGYLY